jgi:hypothetical protein
VDESQGVPLAMFQQLARYWATEWLIMKNGEHAIGLSQRMFEKNILTFNPGWHSNAQRLDTYRRPRPAARVEGSRSAVARGGGRVDNRPRQFSLWSTPMETPSSSISMCKQVAPAL